MKTKTTRRLIATSVAVLVAASLTACSSSSKNASGCGDTVTKGKLTIATGQPAYYPWVIDDKPESGNGFESRLSLVTQMQTSTGFVPPSMVLLLLVRRTLISTCSSSPSLQSALKLLTSLARITPHHRQSCPTRAARLLA